MDSLEKFLSHRIERLTANRPIPIDLAAVSAAIGAVVEEREMVPEAVMQPHDGQFHIYIQSNFKELPGGALRRRFSWAHEIGHILFYESCDGKLKPRTDTPRGEALEAACHRAASMILIPAQSLHAELQKQTLDDAAQVISLADRFEVSVEVMIRRLHQIGMFDNDWTVVLARRIGPRLAIEFAAYPVWLKPYLPEPKRGVEFSLWFRGTEPSAGILERRVRDQVIKASSVDVSTSLVIFELRPYDLSASTGNVREPPSQNGNDDCARISTDSDSAR